MKKIYPVFILVISLAFGCNNTGQKPVSGTPAQINFKKTAYDFGVIPIGFEGKCEFEFQNTSEIPLVVNDVKTSCGCTSPEWPKNPVMPGKKGVIKIKYNASSQGVAVRSITVFSNAKNSPFMLFIRAEVKSEKKSK